MSDPYVVDIPVIRPGSRGLHHIGSKDVKRMGRYAIQSFVYRLRQEAKRANVTLTTKTVNRVLMIAWVPK